MNKKRWFSFFTLLFFGGLAAAWAALKAAEQTPHGMAPPSGPKRRSQAVQNNGSYVNGW